MFYNLFAGFNIARDKVVGVNVPCIKFAQIAAQVPLQAPSNSCANNHFVGYGVYIMHQQYLSASVPFIVRLVAVVPMVVADVLEQIPAPLTGTLLHFTDQSIRLEKDICLFVHTEDVVNPTHLYIAFAFVIYINDVVVINTRKAFRIKKSP